ncbi:MAG: isochorismatase family cysteine hydrolase [Rhodospirillaceae bacterium]|nr:isochorismatase family cysteine hydrolase [Rhodospirillaceae bacterium]
MKFDPSAAVLLLIDIQQGFCGPERAGVKRDTSVLRPAVEGAAKLLKVAREANIPVIYTSMAFAPDYADGGLLTRELRPNLKKKNELRRDTKDAEIMPEIAPEPGDLVIYKQRYSAVIKTDLEFWLRSRGRHCVIVGGVTTGMCVESTVRDLAQLDFHVFVVPEACGDMNPDTHKRAMDVFAMAFGRVVPLEQMAAAINAGGADIPIDSRYDW